MHLRNLFTSFILLAACGNATAAIYLPRVPSPCSTYGISPQFRDAYFFDASGSNVTGALPWTVPGLQSTLSPLYEVMYQVSPGDDDYYATTSTGWRDSAIAGGFKDSNLPLKLNGDGKSIIGFIEGKCQPGTKRLSRFYSKTYGTHYYSTNGEAPKATNTPADAVWTKEETYEGFIWPTQIPESEALKRCKFDSAGKFSSRIMSQSMIDRGALAAGYTCESTPIGYVMTDDNYFFSNAAKRESNFMQRCNKAGYPWSNGCYPTHDRLSANLGGGFFQTSTYSGSKRTQMMTFKIDTPDFFESGANSHLAFGLLSSAWVGGTYTNPSTANVKAVVLGMGPSSVCGTTAPTVWLEALGNSGNPVIPGTCARLGSLRMGSPLGDGQFILRNGQTYNVQFDVSKDGSAHYLVRNAGNSAEFTEWTFDIRAAFKDNATGYYSFAHFPTATGYYATATENPQHDFTVHVRNFNVTWP